MCSDYQDRKLTKAKGPAEWKWDGSTSNGRLKTFQLYLPKIKWLVTISLLLQWHVYFRQSIDGKVAISVVDFNN